MYLTVGAVVYVIKASDLEVRDRMSSAWLGMNWNNCHFHRATFRFDTRRYSYKI